MNEVRNEKKLSPNDRFMKSIEFANRLAEKSILDHININTEDT